MSEHPILFKGEMVRGILNTRPNTYPAGAINPARPFKWQTRRIVKPQPPMRLVMAFNILDMDSNNPYGVSNPYEVGDLLWVKETWGAVWPDECEVPLDECIIEYRADLPPGCLYYPGCWPPDEAKENPDAPRWKSPLFMPRWASRETLVIKDVHLESIQSITWRNVLAEGVGVARPLRDDVDEKLWATHLRVLFRSLWNEINGRPKEAKRNPYTHREEHCYVSYPWDDMREEETYRGKPHYIVGNPMVWAISFMRMEQ